MKTRLLDSYLEVKKPNKVASFFSKILLCLIVLFSSLIYTSLSDSNLLNFKKYVFETNFDFASFRSFYEKYAGKIDKKAKEEELMVFNESFLYNKSENYLEGVNFYLDSESEIKAINGGIVVFKGDKEGYNQTIIIQGSNGFDFWYGNLDVTNVSIYDYVSDNDLVGLASSNLYLVITKDNKYYTYEEYLQNV